MTVHEWYTITPSSTVNTQPAPTQLHLCMLVVVSGSGRCETLHLGAHYINITRINTDKRKYFLRTCSESYHSGVKSEIANLKMENGSKFDVKECVRMTSIVCSSENQVKT